MLAVRFIYLERIDFERFENGRSARRHICKIESVIINNKESGFGYGCGG